MGKTWTRIDPNMGLTPIPFMSGLIYLTPSLYGALLVYYSVSNQTYLSSHEPSKCTKEVVCQLRPCYMLVEERLRDDAENGKLSVPVPNPSETSSLKMMESRTKRNPSSLAGIIESSERQPRVNKTVRKTTHNAQHTIQFILRNTFYCKLFCEYPPLQNGRITGFYLGGPACLK